MLVDNTAEQFRRVLHEVDVIRLLNEDRIFELLKSCYLNISEEDVLKTIKVWISYDYDARRPSFQKLLHCIRPLESLRVCGDTFPFFCIDSKIMFFSRLSSFWTS